MHGIQITWHRILNLKYAINTKKVSHNIIIKSIFNIWKDRFPKVLCFLCASKDDLLNMP